MINKNPIDFLIRKLPRPGSLYHHFINHFETIGPVELLTKKSMIGISNTKEPVASITQFSKNFIHVVFPFLQPYAANLCFKK